MNKQKRTVQELDLEIILRNMKSEGYSAEEFARRVMEYNKVLDRRIDEFQKDLEEDTVSESADVNGLEKFFKGDGKGSPFGNY